MTVTRKRRRTATTDPSRTQRRLSPARAVFAVVVATTVFAVAACTTSDDEVSPESTTATSSVNPTAATATTTTTTAATTTTTQPPQDTVDAGALLRSALERYDEGYRFDATVSVGDQVAVEISGVVIESSAQMSVSSGDGVVDYVITPEVQWIRVEGGEWLELESDGPFDPPLADLASPTTIVAIGTSDEDTAAVAVYPGGVFDSEQDVELQLLFVDGYLVKAAYLTTEAAISTTFGPLDGDTIEVPGA